MPPCDKSWIEASFFSMLGVSFVWLIIQYRLVNDHIKSMDPDLFEYVKGPGYASDPYGLYGWWIVARVIRVLYGRPDLTRHFPRLFLVYAICVWATAVLLVLYVALTLIYGYVCP